MDDDDQRCDGLQTHSQSQQLNHHLHGPPFAESAPELGCHHTGHHKVDQAQELVELEQTWMTWD